MYCSNCGAQIPEGSKFCPECGVRLSPSVDDIQRQQERAEKSQKSARKDARKKPKWRKRIIILIVILGLLAWLYLPDTRGLYIYSTMTVKSTDQLTKKDHQEFEELFQGKYMLHTDNEYTVLDPLNGLGFTESSIKEAEEEIGRFEFTTQGNYAYIEITFSNSKDHIIVSFIKPSLEERIYFISKTFSWT